MNKHLKKIVLVILIFISQHQNVFANEGNTLYVGKLVRLQFYLDPASNRGWSGDYPNLLKKDLLDEHFDGSKSTIYKMQIRALTYKNQCVQTGNKIIMTTIASQFVFIIKTIRPDKRTVYESTPFGYSKKYSSRGDCGYKEITEEINTQLKKEMLKKLVTFVSLLMSQAEGKDVHEQLVVATKELNDDETSSSVFWTHVGNAYAGAIDGAGNIIKDVAEAGVGTDGGSSISGGLALSSNNNNVMDMMREHQKKMQSGYASLAKSRAQEKENKNVQSYKKATYTSPSQSSRQSSRKTQAEYVSEQREKCSAMGGAYNSSLDDCKVIRKFAPTVLSEVRTNTIFGDEVNGANQSSTPQQKGLDGPCIKPGTNTVSAQDFEGWMFKTDAISKAQLHAERSLKKQCGARSSPTFDSVVQASASSISRKISCNVTETRTPRLKGVPKEKLNCNVPSFTFQCTCERGETNNKSISR